ncbi:MAG TPA: phenylalanine--tRNA ligase subunit beta [Chthoniobacteraceae bacterium]|jgi:phenylalanyl-tRNA synthetase beta chain|nr:phenylalanine--tRNA ligase subunit beta [Chthoniobacteraceae bacterium]
MNVSLNWLREFVELPKSTQELVDLLTLAGVEVEAVHERGANIPNVVVAQILESTQHPNADRLSVCKVDYGKGEPAQIVCGAKNYKVGDKVPLALPGAVLPGDFKIKVGKLRGVESQGMMCSAKELGLGEGDEGLLILPQDAPIGAPLSQLFPSDTILELEITPNRPDLLSHYGIAREIAALRGIALAQPPFKAASATAASPRVGIHAADLCPFYSARRIRGVKVGPSPDWLRSRLEAVGIRSINNIVDVTNYVMMEMGQPLHAFDEAKLAGAEIRVRHANEGEPFHALDGKIYTLNSGDLVIADAQSAAAVAGVMGGELTGVTAATADILLESALFNPQSVRRTSRRLGLASDSSYRFERGIDPATVLAASDRATQIILQVAGGAAEPGIETAGAIPVTSRTVALRPARCNALLGAEVPEARIDALLTGFGLRKVNGGWQIPSFRSDLTREADLIEEITRAYGIENITGSVTGRPVPASPADATHDARMELRRRLAGFGFYEARTFSLISAQAAAGGGVAIRNPLIEDQAVLRPSLIPGLLAALERNLRGGAKSVRLFELGRVFAAGGERVTLAALLTGDALAASWRETAPRKTDLFDLKGVLESLGIEGLTFAPADIDGMLPAMRIEIHGHPAGSLGQLAPARLRALDCTAPAALFELDLATVKLRGAPARIAPIPRFPAVTRDIAIIADSAVAHARIEEVLSGANEPLLASAQLFDLFSDPEGIRIPAGQKSLAYSLTYRSAEKTLTADEVNGAHARLKERLKAALNVNFRE